MTPNASPPRPPFVPMSESPPRPPCIVVTQFDEKLGDVYTAAIPAAAAPAPAVPGAPAAHRSVPTDAASDVLENVPARTAVSRTDQNHRVRVAPGAAVPVRRPTGSTESPAAAGHSVGRVRE